MGEHDTDWSGMAAAAVLSLTPGQADRPDHRYNDPQLADVRRDMLRRLYEILRDRGDNFYHWMTSMFEVGSKSYDAALSHIDSDQGRRT